MSPRLQCDGGIPNYGAEKTFLSFVSYFVHVCNPLLEIELPSPVGRHASVSSVRFHAGDATVLVQLLGAQEMFQPFAGGEMRDAGNPLVLSR